MRKIIFFISIIILISESSAKNNKNINCLSESDDSDSTFYEFDFNIDPNNKEIIEQHSEAVKLISVTRLPVCPSLKDSCLKEAVNILKNIIKKRKIYYRAHTNLSLAYAKLKEYEKAEKVLLDLLELKKYPSGIYYLGVLYEKKGKIKLAEDQYRKSSSCL